MKVSCNLLELPGAADGLVLPSAQLGHPLLSPLALHLQLSMVNVGINGYVCLPCARRRVRWS